MTCYPSFPGTKRICVARVYTALLTLAHPTSVQCGTGSWRVSTTVHVVRLPSFQARGLCCCRRCCSCRCCCLLCYHWCSSARSYFFFFSFSHISTFQLLDKPWSQVSSLLPPGSRLQFLSHIGFSNPTAPRFFIDCC